MVMVVVGTSSPCTPVGWREAFSYLVWRDITPVGDRVLDPVWKKRWLGCTGDYMTCTVTPVIDKCTLFCKNLS